MPLTLSKKRIYGDWVKAEAIGAELKIDYATREQQRVLDYLVLKTGVITTDFDGLSDEQRAKLIVTNQQYMEMALKFWIKDWKGIQDPDGNQIPCRIVDGELAGELHESLIEAMSFDQLRSTYEAIRQVLEFTDADKKKSLSAPSSRPAGA